MTVVSVCNQIESNLKALREELGKAANAIDSVYEDLQARNNRQAETIASLQDTLERQHREVREFREYKQAFEDLLSVMSLPEMASLLQRVAKLHLSREDSQQEREDIPETDVMEFIRISFEMDD